MNTRIVYLYHNAFLVAPAESSGVPGPLLVFDYPMAEHRGTDPDAVARILMKEAAGRDVVVFVSHSHPDHFDPQTAAVLGDAASIRFVVSDDVADMFPDSLPEDAVVMEPDETREVAGLAVETLESNDLGVAFLIETSGIWGETGPTLYFGGDLALWDWGNAPKAQMKHDRAFYAKAVERVALRGVDIAFSNTDFRLKTLSGAGEFVLRVAPPLFVPMHLFGYTNRLQELPEFLDLPQDRLFLYSAPGDAKEWPG